MALGLLVLVYTFVPIAVVVLMSFNDNSKSRNVYAFQEFTVGNWTNMCGPDGMCAAVGRSIGIALLARPSWPRSSARSRLLPWSATDSRADQRPT